MKDWKKTLLAQYANSPTLTAIIECLNEAVDPSAGIDAFFSTVWDVSSAGDAGLTDWGKIVGVGRTLLVDTPNAWFGFSEATGDFTPFDEGSFWNGDAATSTYVLSTEAWRTLVMVKAMANVTGTTIPVLNRMLAMLFPDRGRCYALDLGGMAMRYVFEFDLQPFELAIITHSGVFPRPAGVLISAAQLPVNAVFGFSEAGPGFAPFDQGTFFTGESYAV